MIVLFSNLNRSTWAIKWQKTSHHHHDHKPVFCIVSISYQGRLPVVLFLSRKSISYCNSDETGDSHPLIQGTVPKKSFRKLQKYVKHRWTCRETIKMIYCWANQWCRKSTLLKKLWNSKACILWRSLWICHLVCSPVLEVRLACADGICTQRQKQTWFQNIILLNQEFRSLLF